MLSRGRIFWVLFAYLLFVVYGSLIPFDYREHSLAEAWVKFADIRYLDLGLGSRADWIANIVLYIPLSFLACLWLLGTRHVSVVRYLALPVVLAGVLLVAVAVEFAQIFVAPRTVSINDLIAETLGAVAGLALWLFGRGWLQHMWQSFREGGRRSIVAVLSAYAVFYLAQSLFPFDFVVARSELAWKLGSDYYGWLLAGDCPSMLRCLARLLGELFATAPLGVLASLAYPRLGSVKGSGMRRALVIGLLLGLMLELVQFFLASGVSQGLSVVMRGLGLMLGVALGRGLRHFGPSGVAKVVRILSLFAAVPYLVALAALAGWFDQAWLPVAQFGAELSGVRMMPFFYHYFSTEAQAMMSLLANTAMYLPVGLAVWAWYRSASSHDVAWPARGGVVVASLLAGGLALALELGKVLAPAKHPDFTNLLIAAVAAVFGYLFMRWLESALSEQRGEQLAASGAALTAQAETPQTSWAGTSGSTGTAGLTGTSGSTGTSGLRGAPGAALPAELTTAGWSTSASAPTSTAVSTPAPASAVARSPALSVRGMFYAVPFALAIAAGWSGYPLMSALLALCLVAYGVLLWRRPLWWFFVIPLLLPLLDLSQHTGRLLVDEFDLFVLVTLLVIHLRDAGHRPLALRSLTLLLALTLLWTSWAVSSLPQLAGWLGGWLGSQEGMTITGSHSPAEAWMVGKGMLWALLLFAIIRRTPRQHLARARGYVLNSLSVGLVVLSLVVLVERHAFVGLGNFDNAFRVTGTFSTMNTGGAYIEAYIALAFPALLVWVLAQRKLLYLALGVAAVALAAYAMLVTFSRVGYVAFAVGFVVVLLAWLFSWRAGGRLSGQGPGRLSGEAPDGNAPSLLRKTVVLVALLSTVAVLVVPVLSGGFASYRLSRSVDDFSFRLNHWQQALSMMDSGLLSSVRGVGFGQYPIYHLLYADQGRASGSYVLAQENDNVYLRMRAGQTAYLEQRIAIAPDQHYELTFRVRQPDDLSPGLAAMAPERPPDERSGGNALTVFICEKALLYSFGCVSEPVTLAQNPATGQADWDPVTISLAPVGLGGDGWSGRPVKISLHNASGAVEIDDISLKGADGRELLANGDFSEGVKRWLFVTDQDLAWHIHQQWVEVYFAQGVLGLSALVLLLLAVARALFRPLLQGDAAARAFTASLLAFLTVGLLGSTLDSARMLTLFYLCAFCVVLLFRPQRRQPPVGL